MSLSLHHRSNKTGGGTRYAQRVGEPGRGWYTNWDSWIVPVTGGKGVFQANNTVAYWQVQDNVVLGGVNHVYTPRPGVRLDVDTRYDTGSNYPPYYVRSRGRQTMTQFNRMLRQGVEYYVLGGYVDPYGNAVNVYYDGLGRLDHVVDASGSRTLTFHYTGNTVWDYMSDVVFNAPGEVRTWAFSRDANGNLTQVSLPPQNNGGANETITMAYTWNDGTALGPNDQSNIKNLFDPRGSWWSYHYQLAANNEIRVASVHQPVANTGVQQWEANGTTFSWSFQSGSDLCTIGVPVGGFNGNPVTYRYGYHRYSTAFPWSDQWNYHPIYQDQPPGYSTWETYTFNNADLTLTQLVDRRGKTWQYTYDTGNHGLLFTKKTPYNKIWAYGYINDRLVETQSPLGVVTSTEYNTQGDVVKTTVDPTTWPTTGVSRPGAVPIVTSEAAYLANGNLNWTKKGAVNATTFTNYDNYGNAWTVTSPSGGVTSRVFNSINLMTSQSPPSPQGTTTYTYDLWSRVKTVTPPGSAAISTVYDANNNVVSVTDARGFTTTTAYDRLNRKTSLTVPVDANSANDKVTSWAYDVGSQLGTLTNPNGKVTNYDYDSRGNVWNTYYPDGRTITKLYDDNGNVTQLTNGRGQNSVMAYDDRGLLTQTIHGQGTSTQWTSNFHYNDDDQRDWNSDVYGTTTYTQTFTYDSPRHGFLTSNYQPFPNATLSFTYDSYGRRRTMGVGAQTWTYDYDNAGRQYRVSQAVGDAVPLQVTSFNPDDSVDGRVLGNGRETTFGYDARGRVNAINHYATTVAPTPDNAFGYTYDNNSNVTAATGTQSWTSSPVYNWSVAYVYDRANRMTSEIETGPAYAYNNQFVYDKNDNRVSHTLKGSLKNYTYTVSGGDRLANAENYIFNSYDTDGNPTSVTDNNRSGLGSTMTYDADGNVTQITYSAQPTDVYLYDGDGHRTRRTVGSTVTNYAYDGGSIVAEYSGTGALRYDLPGVGWVVASGNVQWYSLHNLRGDLVASYQGTSPQVVRDWDAYGGYYTLRGGTDTDFRYVADKSVVYDASTQWYSMGRRSYSWLLGRFLTQDPIGYAGGTTNLYSYCGDNPVASSDPTGLEKDHWQPGKRHFVFAYGDTSGPPQFADSIAGLWERKIGLYDIGNVTVWRDKHPAKTELIQQLIHANYFFFWGHGFKGGMVISDGVSIEHDDWKYIASERQRLHIPKMEYMDLRSCTTLADFDLVNTLLSISTTVSGHTGWTTNSPYETFFRPLTEYDRKFWKFNTNDKKGLAKDR